MSAKTAYYHMLLRLNYLSTNLKTAQILLDCGQYISWKSTGNHICWSVRQSIW